VSIDSLCASPVLIAIDLRPTLCVAWGLRHVRTASVARTNAAQYRPISAAKSIRRTSAELSVSIRCMGDSIRVSKIATLPIDAGLKVPSGSTIYERRQPDPIETLKLTSELWNAHRCGLAEEETTLKARSNEAAHARAEASFRKEERAKEGAKAMMEYQAKGRMIREKMERLKALRLAKEAADKKRAG